MKSKSSVWKVIAIIEAIIIFIFIALIVFFFPGNGPKDKKKMIIVKPQYSVVLSTITSDEAARMFFEGCAKEDWEAVQKLYPIKLDDDFKEYLGGIQIISIGKAYKSSLHPLYHGVFIPYEIKFKTGDTKKWNLAIRNDNKYRVWQVDGGI
jgi:hypothetical protein